MAIAAGGADLEVEFVHQGLLENVDGAWRLIGSRCRQCGDVRFPPAIGCPNCHAGKDQLAPYPLGRRGFVYTFSRVFKAPPPFKGPYIVAWVQMPEGPRVLAQLECPADADVFGKPCELTVGNLWETSTAIGQGYKFKMVTP